MNAPDIAMICDMADLYGVSVDYLVGHEIQGGLEATNNLMPVDREEQLLVDAFRQCNGEGRAMLISLAEVLAESVRYRV